MRVALCLLLVVCALAPTPNTAQLAISWENFFTTKKTVIYGATEDNSCQTADGVDGVCVPHEECKNGIVIEDGVINGVSRVRPRIQETCPANEICCVLPGETATKNPITPTVPGTNSDSNSTSDPIRTVIEPVGCGIRYESGTSNRIAGDVLANFGEFNWAVAVFKVEGNSEEYKCGASLIHPRAALTAALSVSRGKRWRIRAGDYNIIATDELLPHQSSDVQEIVRHKQFNSGTFTNNIAILFLATAIRPAANIGFACLPQPTQETPPGTTCIVTGWGLDRLVNGTLSNFIKMLELPIVEHSKCQTQLRSVANPKFVLSPSNICAGGEGDDACKGDGGSPLVCPYERDPTRYYQAGIVSFGIGCGENGIPGVYTDVSCLRTWIDSTMNAKGYTDSTYTHTG